MDAYISTWCACVCVQACVCVCVNEVGLEVRSTFFLSLICLVSRLRRQVTMEVRDFPTATKVPATLVANVTALCCGRCGGNQ